MSILKETKLSIRISRELKLKYIKYCDDNGFSLSKKIRLFIEEDLKNDKSK